MFSSSMVTQKIPAHESNYTKGRGGFVIDHITIHHGATTSLESIGKWFANPEANVSAQYGVGGTLVHQYVSERDRAWCDGNWDSNCTTISIETTNSTGLVNERNDDPGSWQVADDTLDTLIKLVADVAERNNLGKLRVGTTLCYHNMYTDTFCPGNYLRARLQYICDRANKINNP